MKRAKMNSQAASLNYHGMIVEKNGLKMALNLL